MVKNNVSQKSLRMGVSQDKITGGYNLLNRILGPILVSLNLTVNTSNKFGWGSSDGSTFSCFFSHVNGETNADEHKHYFNVRIRVLIITHNHRDTSNTYLSIYLYTSINIKTANTHQQQQG